MKKGAEVMTERVLQIDLDEEKNVKGCLSTSRTASGITGFRSRRMKGSSVQFMSPKIEILCLIQSCLKERGNYSNYRASKHFCRGKG